MSENTENPGFIKKLIDTKNERPTITLGHTIHIMDWSDKLGTCARIAQFKCMETKKDSGYRWNLWAASLLFFGWAEVNVTGKYLEDMIKTKADIIKKTFPVVNHDLICQFEEVCREEKVAYGWHCHEKMVKYGSFVPFPAHEETDEYKRFKEEKGLNNVKLPPLLDLAHTVQPLTPPDHPGPVEPTLKLPPGPPPFEELCKR